VWLSRSTAERSKLDPVSQENGKRHWRAAVWLLGGLVLAASGLQAETQTQTVAKTQAAAPHHLRRTARKSLPPPLPSGPRGPVPQIPLDALPAVAPQVTFQNGLLTIVASNSTLGDVLRAVKKETSADIDVPPNAIERVAVNLGPAPPRDVLADLLNGSHFNYILLGSAADSEALVRVVLVAKTGPDNITTTAQAAATPAPVTAKPADDADNSSSESGFDEAIDQAATEADETPPTEPGAKTPQQLLQEMQQRQLQMQQEQNANGDGTTPQTMPQTTPFYPPPGGMRPPIIPQPQQPPQDQ